MDYWSEPAIAESFLKAHLGAAGMTDTCWFQENGEKIVIFPRSDKVTLPVSFKSKKLKVLPTLLGGYGPKGYTWIYRPGAKLDKYALRRAEREGISWKENPSFEELSKLLADWRVWSSPRHFMTVCGHYAQMMSDPRIQFTGAYLGSKLVAAFGIAGNCICFLKHQGGLNWLAGAVWTKALLGRERTNCGDTADGLKQRLGLEKVIVFQPEITYGEPKTTKFDLGNPLRLDDWKEAALYAALRPKIISKTWDRLFLSYPDTGANQVGLFETKGGGCLDMNFEKASLIYLIKHKEKLEEWTKNYREIIYTDSAKGKFHLNWKAYRKRNPKIDSCCWATYQQSIYDFWGELGFKHEETVEQPRTMKVFLSKL